MRCGTLTAIAGLLLLVGIGYSIIKTDDLYLSHAAVTDDTISDLLERRNFNLPLENADLSFTTTAENSAKKTGSLFPPLALPRRTA